MDTLQISLQANYDRHKDRQIGKSTYRGTRYSLSKRKEKMVYSPENFGLDVNTEEMGGVRCQQADNETKEKIAKESGREGKCRNLISFNPPCQDTTVSVLQGKQ